MILKEAENIKSSDKYAQAGFAAEKQMAFYLKRAFENDPKVLIVNGIRLEQSDDAAQIDHLLLHEYGMIIIESKSVTTQVSINDHGEWSRQFNQSKKGMPSPVLQAKRQGEFLKNFLRPHTERLLKKVLGVQAKFDKMPIDIIVAISDTGIINRPNNGIDELEYVCKADRAVEKIQEIINGYRKKESALSLSLGPYIFGKSSRKKVGQFLIENHSPASISPLVVDEKRKKETSSRRDIISCKHCHGTMVEVVYGKYGYYLKCRKCGGNTAIRENCPGCGKQLRVRKEKEKFFLECRDCNTSTLFHKNVVSEK